MFYLYLDSLQKQKEVEKVLDTVSELNNISLRMNEMLNSVGRKILGNGDVEYEEVMKKQFEIIIDFFVDQIPQMLEADEVPDSPDVTEEQKTQIATIIYEQVLEPLVPFPEKSERASRRKFINEYDIALKDKINDLLSDAGIPLKFKKINAVRLNSIYKNKVEIFSHDKDGKSKLLERISDELWMVLL